MKNLIGNIPSELIQITSMMVLVTSLIVPLWFVGESVSVATIAIIAASSIAIACFQILLACLLGINFVKKFDSFETGIFKVNAPFIRNFKWQYSLILGFISIVSGLFLMIVISRLVNDDVALILKETAIVYIVFQGLMILAIFRVTSSFLLNLQNENSISVDFMQGCKNTFSFNKLFSGLILSVLATSLLICFLANRIAQFEAIEEELHHYEQLAFVILKTGSKSSTINAQSFIETLSKANKARLFVIDKHNQSDLEKYKNMLPDFNDKPAGRMISVRNHIGVAWQTRSTGQIVGVIITTQVESHLILFLIFNLTIILISYAVFYFFRKSIKTYANDRIKVIDQLPIKHLSFQVPSIVNETDCFDYMISKVRPTHIEDRDVQQRIIKDGKISREKKALVFASMSHDLRSPLNSIIGFTDLLLKGLDGQLELQQKQTVLKISKESEWLILLIGDILDTAKLDAGHFELQKEWVPSVEVLTDCEVGTKRLLATKCVEFVSHLEPGLPPVMADRDRLSKAILGLISQVLDPLVAGSVCLTASRAKAPDIAGEFLKIEVVDVGRSLSNEDLNHLFDVFEATESIAANADFGGKWLGLSLARRIIRLHGGEVEIVHEDESGILFTIILPLPLDDIIT